MSSYLNVYPFTVVSYGLRFKVVLIRSSCLQLSLAEIGHRLGGKALEEVAHMVRPDTILRGYRKLIAGNFDGSKGRRAPGQPRVDPDIEALILRMAKESTNWGYDRIVGALVMKPPIKTVGNIVLPI